LKKTGQMGRRAASAIVPIDRDEVKAIDATVLRKSADASARAVDRMRVVIDRIAQIVGQTENAAKAIALTVGVLTETDLMPVGQRVIVPTLGAGKGTGQKAVVPMANAAVVPKGDRKAAPRECEGQ
jgi:hypothetical protein